MDFDNQQQKELKQIIDNLIAQRSNPAKDRIKALSLLEITAAGKIGYVLLELLRTECDHEVLISIANSLVKHGDDECVMPLVDIVLGNREIDGADDPIKEDSDKFLKLRCAFIKVLGRLQDEKAVIPLMYMLNDKNENYKIRLNAAEALGRIGDTYAVNPLINLVVDEKENSVYVKESAAKALGMLGDVRAVKPLVEILSSKKGLFSKFSFLKEQVIEALGRLGPSGDKETIKALKDSLIDEAPSVRLSAVETLVSIGDDSLIKILIPSVYDEEEDVARETVRGIYTLGGYLELKNLLEDDKLPGWSRDEIEMSFEEGNYD
ncbi:MAG: HEAT repeat domain-containing protein [Vampirovibrionia bacterium]